MKNVIITLGTGLICLILGPECTWPQRIAILIVAAGAMWCLVEGVSELAERPKNMHDPEQAEELRRRNTLRQLLLTATLPQYVSTLKIRTLAEKRAA